VGFNLLEVPETEYFIARQKKLAEIRKIFNNDDNRQTTVLHNLDNIGKTQFTVTYVKRYKTDYSAIF